MAFNTFDTIECYTQLTGMSYQIKMTIFKTIMYNYDLNVLSLAKENIIYY